MWMCACVEGGRGCMDRMKIVIIIFMPVNVLYDNHMCAILFNLQRTSISNINSI